MADHGCEFAHEAVRHLSRDRDLALALEFLDRGLGIGTNGAGRLQLAVAVFGQRALDCGDAARAGRLRGLAGRATFEAARGAAPVDLTTRLVMGSLLFGSAGFGSGSAGGSIARITVSSGRGRGNGLASDGAGACIVPNIGEG